MLRLMIEMFNLLFSFTFTKQLAIRIVLDRYWSTMVLTFNSVFTKVHSITVSVRGGKIIDRRNVHSRSHLSAHIVF